MIARVLSLDVGPIDDQTTVSKFSSKHPCKGYDLVMWQMQSSAGAAKGRAAKRIADLNEYLDADGRLLVFGARPALPGHPIALEEVLPLGVSRLVSSPASGAQGIGPHGMALVDDHPDLWKPLSCFEERTDDGKPETFVDLMTVVNATTPVGRAIPVGSGWLFLLPRLLTRAPSVLTHVTDWALDFSVDPAKQDGDDGVDATSLTDDAEQRAELARLDQQISRLNSERAEVVESLERRTRDKQR